MNPDFYPTDKIYPLTRIVAAIVVPVLILAFLILYFTPDQSGVRFAWAIKPHMTALFIGAGYLGGAYLFLRTAVGGPWHRVAPGFLPVTAFTSAMLLATFLHWDRFDSAHFPFQLWLILYIVTPFLVPFLWLRNRREDTGAPEPNDAVVPLIARRAMGLSGAGFAVFSLIGLLAPSLLIQIWVWTLSPLTARVLGGWFALLAVGGLTIAAETRWSGWKIGLVSIGLWHALILVGAAMNPGDFTTGLVNWYTILVALALAGMVGLAWQMGRLARQNP